VHGCCADHDRFGADSDGDVHHPKARNGAARTGGFEMLTATLRHPDAQKLFKLKG